MTSQLFGPVGLWVAAFASLATVTVALLGGFGWFARRSQPHLRVTFEQAQPWCRWVETEKDSAVLWVRVAVENHGLDPARGCIGRLIGVATDGSSRPDVDPVQLRWAGFPRSRGFDPIDLRRGQREFLDVVFRRADSPGDWVLDTFGSEDFDPGFDIRLAVDQVHLLQIALFADNADTCGIGLRIEVSDDEPRMTTAAAK
ncbi:hypothetical protein GCM10023322_59660 [Rugosimonospora acidiphila]|uniref:DUF4352 domain-containing protein n=1 Tax=Rugosimonospora acidiphila TaxID=556531 RepID=A0ABP9SFW5_9ACTN